MSADTLVICLTESNDNNNLKVYIFYDYKEEKYGVRIYNNVKDKENTFSYYSCDKNILFDFIIAMISDSKDVDITLMNYKNLPLESDNITYRLLEYTESNKVEMFGYIYDEEYEDNDEDYDSFHPKEVFKKMLTIIKHIYNEY